MIIRKAEMKDAGLLLDLMAEVEKSGFMLYEAGERQLTADQLSRRIEAVEKEENSDILVAESDGELIGYLFITGSPSKRKGHNVYLAIGVSEKNRGKGVGTELFNSLDDWAKQQNIHRLELTVMIENRTGLALYQKMGYKIEGIKKNSLKVQDQYIDEYYMSKLLG